MESTNGANDSAKDDDESDVEIVKIVNGSDLGTNDSTFNDFLEFKHKKHSLSIGASSVAACVGYHEFQSIPELMLKHVYQGGQYLLEHDAKLLGLKLLSPEDNEAELLKIAESSGSSTVVETVKRALRVKHGEEEGGVRSIEEANKLKHTIAEQGKKKLNQHQLQILQEGTRQAIDTGCGNSWEEQALDRYQDQCGWEVRERNAECRVWDFEKTSENEEGNNHRHHNNNHDNIPSIRPLGPARVRHRRNQRFGTSVNGEFDNDNKKNYHHRYDSRGVKRKLPSSYDSQISETALMNFSKPHTTDSNTTDIVACTSEKDNDDFHMVTVEGSSLERAEVDAISIEEDEDDDHHFHHSHVRQQNHFLRPQKENCRPFVTIKGMVDGIRDELGPSTMISRETKSQKDDIDDDDLSYGSFSLSRVVVECKHRMRKLLPNGPRFSECIQAVVYCFMYEADDADIVQVLRSSANPKSKSIKEKADKGALLTNYFEKSVLSDGKSGVDDRVKDENSGNVVKETNESNDNEANSTTVLKGGEVNVEGKIGIVASTKPAEENDKNDTINSNVKMTIAVDRVSLDDPNFGHRNNWKTIILPKLRQWVDAVYRIRQSDDKRYRLLTALSAMSSSDAGVELQEQLEQSRKNHARAAWELVFEECDFLRDGMSGERYLRETQ